MIKSMTITELAKFKVTMRHSIECNKPNNIYHSAGV